MNAKAALIGWAARWRVGTRLAAGFGVLLVLVLLVGAVGVAGMQRLDRRVNDIVVLNNSKLGFAQSLGRSVLELEKGMLSLVLASSSEQSKQALAVINHQNGQYDDAKGGLEEMLGLSKPTEAEANVIAKIASHQAAAKPILAKAVALVEDGETEAAQTLIQAEARPVLGKWLNDIDELISTLQRRNDSAATATHMEYVFLRNLAAACMALAFVLSVAMCPSGKTA